MPQPPTNGRTPMSRADAARHASLVRWKKESPLAPQTGGMANPKIAARVKEILAAKQKGKAKAKPKGGKGKATAKPKDGRTKQEVANQNRASVAKQSGMGDLEGTLVRVAAGMARAGDDLEPEKHDALVKKGLAKRHADGSLSLTPAGRKWKSAADKGDADAANAALNDAKAGAADQAAKEQAKGAAKQEREKTKAAKLAERAAKQKKQQQAQKQKAQARQKIKAEREKARAAKADKGKAKAAPSVPADPSKQRAGTKAMSDIDELAIKAGARHSKMDASHLDEAARHLHAAGATCPDCAPGDDEAAGKAIKGIMDHPAYYAQHECNDIMQAGSALSTLAMLIQSELSEEDEDDADIGQLVDAARTLIKFIGGELDELEGAASDAAEGRTAGDVPMAKATDDFFAVKSIGDSDDVRGPAVRFGSSEEPDLSETRDYFTQTTDYWLKSWDKRPMLWHHTMPQVQILQQMKTAGAAPDEIKAMRDAILYLEENPVIGVWTKATVDPVAVWMNGQLDTAHRYRAAIKRMIDLGMLKISTDSAPHLVRREKQSNGTHEVKRWPIIAASLTPSAAEPRLFDVQALKSWYDVAGITLPFAIDEEPEAVNPESARRDGVKADDERTRRILLEIDLLTLEETAL